jgi:hypothetical protein
MRSSPATPVERRSGSVLLSATYAPSWQHDGETRPFPRLAFDGDGPAHRHTDSLYDPQTDPETAAALLHAALEPLEDTGLVIGVDADTMVAHLERREILVGVDHNVNRSSGAESNGVRQEIAADLLEAQSIPLASRLTSLGESEFAACDGQLGLERTDDLAHRLRQIGGLWLQVDAARRQTRHVEQAVQCLEQSMQALFDAAELRLHPLYRHGFAHRGQPLRLLDGQPQLEG